jgi:hypothetical protein
MWDLWWTKWRWGRFSPSTSVSPANLHSTNFCTITITYQRGWYNRPVSGRSTQSPTAQIKYIYIYLIKSRFRNNKFLHSVLLSSFLLKCLCNRSCTGRRKASHALLKLSHERNIRNNFEWTCLSGFGVNKMQQN